MDLNDTHMIKPDIEYDDNYVHNNSYMKGYIDGLKTVLGVRIDRKQFEGMTDGEVFLQTYPEAQIKRNGNIIEVASHDFSLMATSEWWDSPYQKEGE